MKRIFTSLALMLTAVLLIATLLYIKGDNNDAKKGFERKFLTPRLFETATISLNGELFSFAKVTDSSILLYDFRNPNKTVWLDNDLRTLKNDSLKLRDTCRFKGINVHRYWGSSDIVLSGMSSTVYKADRATNLYTKSVIDSIPFYSSEAISGSTFIFLSVVKKGEQRQRKIVKADWSAIHLSEFVPEKQTDEYYSTDGQFKLSSNGKQIIYMYYYRGQLICLDTNLKLVRKIKTIDTVSFANLAIQSNGTNTYFVGNPHLVNKRLCIDEGFVYINSSIKADNQKLLDFSLNETIDVYDTNDGSYKTSFYLPKNSKQKLTEFQVYKNNVIAIYGNTIHVFKISRIV